MADHKVVDINVGGQISTTKLSTLTEKYPDSRLARSVAAYFNGKTEADDSLIEILQDQNSRMFIDRDGAIFRYVLDYLRRSSNMNDWVLKMVPSFDIYRLRIEAEFYGLNELINEVRKFFYSVR